MKMAGTGHRKLPISNSQFPMVLGSRLGSHRSEVRGLAPAYGRVVAVFMDASLWKPKKPFDLRERLFEFGLLTIRTVQFLHARGPIGIAVSYQILNAGMSAGANYEEADDVQAPAIHSPKRKSSFVN